MQQEYARIFLLSHMRAYTSLLGHILGSHPQINGYYEMHMSYLTTQDLSRQQHLYSKEDILKPNSQYLFDKLLHNDYLLELDQLNPQNTVILIALRKPKPTITSIMELFNNKNTQHPYATAELATQYYIERLIKLSTFSQQNKQRYFYFDTELISQDTEDFLATVSQWLQLKTTLTEEYQIFNKTGIAGAGDSSIEIKSGKIIRHHQKTYAATLPDELATNAITTYNDCRKQLIENAISYIIASP
ncbi:hypothetical protein TI03_00850 [Achromatium sp. WMS1]|nr:hypothetical protein TI03_00850 [Achromatium sp. WMS1]